MFDITSISPSNILEEYVSLKYTNLDDRDFKDIFLYDKIEGIHKIWNNN